MLASPEQDQSLRRAGLGLAMVRIWVGTFFLMAAYPKIPWNGLSPHRWHSPTDLQASARELLELDGPPSFFEPVVEACAQAPRIAAGVLGVTEGLTGLLLLLGFFTRTAAVLGILLSVGYGLAFGGLHRVYGALAMMVLALLTCLLLGRAGCQWGMDSLFLSGDLSTTPGPRPPAGG